MWGKTIESLQTRLRSGTDPEEMADLHHRLTVAHIKLEDYGTALGWVERGLQLKAPSWEHQLLEDKAEVLFLLGREAESMALLNEIYPKEPPVICRMKDEAPRHHRTIESLGMVCPECGFESDYGVRSCPKCGRRVDECFQLVKRSRSVLGPYGKGVGCQMPSPHRTRAVRVFHTTYTVDFDDPERYLTAVQDQFLGRRRETITTRKRVLWSPLAAALCLAAAFLLAISAAIGMGHEGTTIAALALLGIATVLPLLLFFAWAAVPPRTSGALAPDEER